MCRLYDAILRTAGPAARRYHRISVIGRENLPGPGRPGLLALNHSGCLWWDGFCLAFALEDRRVRFIAHHWDSTHLFMRAFLEAVGARYLDPSLETITEESPVVGDLRRGELLAQFPEESYHTFRDRYTLYRFSPQVIRYAWLARAPILPGAVIGVEEACPTFFGLKRWRRPLHIPYHPPVLFPARVTIDIGRPVTVEELAGGPPETESGCRSGADRLREHVKERIEAHRRCRLSDLSYNDRRSWF